VRVSEGGGAGPREAKGPRPAKRFGEALRTASRAARAGGPPLPSAEAAPPAAARAVAGRRASADHADDALRSRRDGFREEARLAPPSPGAPAQVAEPVTAPELRALVRTLPLAVQTFGVREGAPLALSFGRSLDVELRAAPGGVELVLRPEARLARASEAELPGVVAALARKGIAVSRAEVRVRGSGSAGGPAPRVDVAPGVR